jgi:hypothetical protein
MTEYVITDQMREWGKANGYNVDLHYEYFLDYIANKSGKPYKDLDAAFRNCVRADWGDLRKAQRIQQAYARPEEFRAERTQVNGKVWVNGSDGQPGYWR